MQFYILIRIKNAIFINRTDKRNYFPIDQTFNINKYAQTMVVLLLYLEKCSFMSIGVLIFQEINDLTSLLKTGMISFESIFINFAVLWVLYVVET